MKQRALRELLRRLLRPRGGATQPEAGKRQGHRAGAGRDSARGSKSRFTGDVQADVHLIELLFGKTAELKVRWLDTGSQNTEQAAVYLDGLVDDIQIAAFIIKPLQEDVDTHPPTVPAQKTIHGVDEAVQALTHGNCIVFSQGKPPVAYNVIMWAHRQVDRTELEPSELGSQEGFVEDLLTNVVLMRRRLRTHKLQSESLTVGKLSPTNVRLLYIKDVVRDELVEEVRGRIEEIDIDGIVGVNYIEELTRDSAWSPFPSTVTTARPDRVAGMLLEGYVAIMVDGTPMVTVLPGTLNSMIQTSDDYYHNFYVATFTRIIRWTAAFVGMLASAFYVATISYHHELIPTRLLFTIAAGREGVPFPPIVEALLMEVAFELLREAGLRVPLQIGQAVSIVGVLVIGDAAVRAGLISPLMIVVIGMTAISTFAIPSIPLSNTVRLLRFPIILLGGFLGLFGVFFGVMLLMALLLSTRSYGVPFVTPFVPASPKGLVDSLWRAPLWRQRHRPWHNVQPDNVRQQPPGQKPEPDESKEPGKTRGSG